jgi:hypothetical protein
MNDFLVLNFFVGVGLRRLEVSELLSGVEAEVVRVELWFL